MNHYRHIIKYISTGNSLEIDNNNAELSQQELNDLNITLEDVIISNIDITSYVLEQELMKKQQEVDNALAASWDFITPYYDQPAFIQIGDWKASLPKDHPVQEYIAAIEVWKSSIMFEYLMVKKPYIMAGIPIDLNYSFVGSPPCKFTDLFLIVNPYLVPYVSGWSAPDISNYQPGTRENPKELTF